MEDGMSSPEHSTSQDPSTLDSSFQFDAQPPSSRKQRKQYTISKQRENWTDEEHQKFIEALKLFDRDWKKIEKYIGTKTVIQIRSHAQKHFLKVQKNNTGEHIPPARPKRKSSQAYPKSKIVEDASPQPSPSTAWGPPENLASNSLLNNPSAFSHWMASNGLLPGVISNNSQALEMHRRQQEHLQQAQQFYQQSMSLSQHINESNQSPNFGKIYAFLGSLFDPNSIINHAQMLNEMTSIDKETVQLLMHNLTINLANQQYKEQHAFLLEQYKSALSKVQDQRVTNAVITSTSTTTSVTSHPKQEDSNTPLSNVPSPYFNYSPTMPASMHDSGATKSDDSNSETVPKSPC